MFRNRRGNFPFQVAGLEFYIYPADDDAIKFHDLQEGDIIVMKGKRFKSFVIGTVSEKVSHVGQMMKLGGKLWFVESVDRINPVITTSWDSEGCCPVRSGVSASALPTLMHLYKSTGVYRPTPALTEKELDIMRKEFMNLYGNPYEKNLLRFFSVISGIPVMGKGNSFYCSQLTAYLFKTAGRLNPNYGMIRYKTGHYRPNDIVHSINCNYKGKLPGTTPIVFKRNVRNDETTTS